MGTEKNNKQDNQRRAAAAAAAVLLALKAEQDAIQAYPQPLRVTVSAWQAVLRSNIHNTRGNIR